MDSRSLSRTEAKVILSLEAARQEVVSLLGIQQAAGVSPGFARKLVHGLVRKGWLQRARRGTYLLNPSRHGPDAIPDADPFGIGRLLADPYYFGYATAAELHGLLPQAGRTYYIVTPSRQGSRRFGSSQFRAVHITRRRFFGVQQLRRRGRELRVSDLERTVLDCLSRPELAGGMGGVSQVFALAKPRLEWARLTAYLDRLGNRSLGWRVGFLSEIVRPSIRPPKDWIRRALPRAEDPYVPLGPVSQYGRRGARDPDWHLIRNVPREALFAEGEIP